MDKKKAAPRAAPTDDNMEFKEWVAAVRAKLTSMCETPPETPFMEYMRQHWVSHGNWKAGMEPKYAAQKWLAHHRGEEEELYPTG